MARLVLCLLLLCPLVAPGRGATVNELHARLTKLQQTLDALTRQAMLQQLYIEEKIRGDGNSGVFKTALDDSGTRPYHANTHSRKHNTGVLYGHSFMSRSLSTEGFTAVLNGVQFRTDAELLTLKQAHRTSKVFKAVQDVEPAKVPPAVLNKKTVEEQTKEMIQWFKAFNTNNYRLRDFRPYFKPLLCYLEGFWELMKPPKDKYFSDEYTRTIPRHQFQATNGARYRYWTYYGFHPAKIFDFNKSEPTYAKFKSRILCHPLKHYVFSNRLRAIDELSSASRIPVSKTYNQHKWTAASRFSVNVIDNTGWTERFYRTGLLDKLMAEIPGLSNHGANLQDNAFETPVYTFPKPTGLLNTAYYHRFYNVKRKGAMGQLARHRSYSDSSVFMAQNTQTGVPPLAIEECKNVNRKRVCKSYSSRMSYAVPLAVVYQTPLQSWNPYNVQEKSYGDHSVTTGGRNGGFTADTAFNGTSPHNCVTIPPGFFSRPLPWDPEYGVLDKSGKVVKAKRCGFRDTIPLIKDVGYVKQVYPIYPVHIEGSSDYKEIAALEDIVMQSAQKLRLLRGQ